MPKGLHRNHAVLAALVVVAAVWAYWATHRVAGGGAGSPAVPVWQVPAREITSLTFRDGEVRTVLRPSWGDGSEPYVWVETQAPARRPPRRERSKPAEPPPADAVESSAFKGSSAVGPVLESFATLTAERDLGPLDPQDAKKFGLPAENAFVELTRGQGDPLRLELGRASFGGNTRYAHEPAGGHLYLVRATDLRRLAAARGSLMDRDLLGLKLNEAARIELTADGRSATFYKLADAGRWGSTADASEEDEDAVAFVSRLQGLAVLRYLDEATAEPGAPALEIRVFRPGAAEPAGWVRLFAAQGPTAMARSAHSRRMVEVSGPPVQQVLKAARPLLHGN